MVCYIVMMLNCKTLKLICKSHISELELSPPSFSTLYMIPDYITQFMDNLNININPQSLSASDDNCNSEHTQKLTSNRQSIHRVR